MNDELHRHMDGDVPATDVSEAVRREAEAWEQLLEAFRVEAPPAPAPPWLETRIMAEIEALPEPGVLRRAMSWFLRPRPLRVSPLALGLAAAAIVAVSLVIRVSSFVGAASGGTDTAGELVYVQFALDAPGATSVAVAGDFDEWEGTFPLEDLDGDGTWSGRAPLRPGVHAYMFLVNGSTWETDPRAERYAEDGFGNRNAILAVAAPST